MPGSVACSSLDSMSVSSRASSLSAGQLNTLIDRRTAIRAQMATVEQQLATLPPSTGRSSQPSLGGMSAAPAAPSAPSAPLPPAATGPALPKPSVPVPPIKPAGAPPLAEPPPLPRSTAHELALPGAMRPGNYAFWPKRLPGASAAKSGRLAAAKRAAIRASITLQGSGGAGGGSGSGGGGGRAPIVVSPAMPRP